MALAAWPSCKGRLLPSLAEGRAVFSLVKSTQSGPYPYRLRPFSWVNKCTKSTVSVWALVHRPWTPPPPLFLFGSVQFKRVCIYALGKTHNYACLRSFPSDAFETVPLFVWLTVALSRPFREDRQALPFCLSCKLQVFVVFVTFCS